MRTLDTGRLCCLVRNVLKDSVAHNDLRHRSLVRLFGADETGSAHRKKVARAVNVATNTVTAVNVRSNGRWLLPDVTKGEFSRI